MNTYKHNVHYYETDRMGITHHSNYIRWMEEARIDFLKQIGWDYARLEESGIISPVVGIDCQYKANTTFSDEIYIQVKVAEFRGVRLKLAYIMTREDGSVVCEAHSEHCFLNPEGKLIRLKREYPEFYQVLFDLANAQEA